MKTFSLAVCALVFAPPVAEAASAITPQSIVLSAGLVADVATINQSNGAGSEIKVLHPTSGTGIKSVVQTFTWNSTDKLGGLGVAVGSGSTWTSVQVQDYELRIYGTSGSAVGSEVATYTFTMNQALATANQWLYFDFGSGLNLTQSSVYFFQLAAVSSGGSILSVKSSFGQGDFYAAGSSSQRNDNSIGFPTSGAWDYTFFLHTTATAIPEPAGIAWLLGGLAVGIVSVRRLRR